MKNTVLIALLILLTSPAFAQGRSPDMTVFGLRLGEKFALPECAFIKKSSLYAENDSTPCFERFYDFREMKEKTISPVNETIQILFPFGKASSFMAGRKAVGQVVSGNLESISFNVMGLQFRDRDQVLSALENKYGEPSRIQKEAIQNSFNASVSSIKVIWSFADLTVSLRDLVTDNIDSGLVNVDTVKGAVYRVWLPKN
jgi:hypothetical protein